MQLLTKQHFKFVVVFLAINFNCYGSEIANRQTCILVGLHESLNPPLICIQISPWWPIKLTIVLMVYSQDALWPLSLGAYNGNDTALLVMSNTTWYCGIPMMTSSDGNISRVIDLSECVWKSPLNYPHKGQWRGALIFSLICVWNNSWVSNGDRRWWLTRTPTSV